MELTTLQHNNRYFMNEVFTHIFNYAGSDIIITDEKLNILSQNSRFEFKNNIFSLESLIPSNVFKKVKKHFENFKLSNNNHIFFKVIINDIPMNINICKIKEKNEEIKGFSIILQDITQELKREIQKETFVDILNHDFKNPLRSNIQVLELLLNGQFGTLNSEMADVIQELLISSNYLKYISENLILKYNNEFNLNELQKEEHSMIVLIREKCNRLMKFIERRKQIIELITKGDISDVPMDVEEMGKVVNNLIINACEQSVENAKIIIEVENNTDNNNIQVSFTDYGYNKTEDNINEIFDEYITCSNKFRKIGYSLDLYNCKKIVEAHGGEIHAQKSNRIGTTIIFSLPITC